MKISLYNLYDCTDGVVSVAGVSDVGRCRAVVRRPVPGVGRVSARHGGARARRAGAQAGVGAERRVVGRGRRDAGGRGAPHLPRPRRRRSSAVPTRAQPGRQQPRVPPPRIRLPGARYQVRDASLWQPEAGDK